ncbi:hypothetical protein KFK09_021000 [Dendrobium nobile]|uniref:Bet v I/Major latex protein domain-containing protein n=1 Tax=Dendrobium nobile TaxID=94219 RepID=A0A8T3AUL1_DENNO|nr:hypothetical protein KFK09_021000 [Dendrobium nobile]
MASKIEFQVQADQVNIEVLWKALTKDKFEVARKAAPDLFAEWQVLESEGNGGNIGLGSLLYFRFGPVAPNVEPFKERVVELDEGNHLVKFQGIEGGFMKQGFTYYVLSFKLDHIGEGNTKINATFTYDLEKDFDGTQILEEFTKIVKYYLNSAVSFLQQKNNV